jgi:molybdate transport system substrate-binding protein
LSEEKLTSFNDLGRGEIQKIAIGNPKTVPAGRYAEELLKYFNLWDVIKDRLIFGENVRQVLDCVTKGTIHRQGETKMYDPAGANPLDFLYSSPKSPD